LERTLVFLLVLIFGEHRTCVGKLLLGDKAGLGCLEHEGEPAIRMNRARPCGLRIASPDAIKIIPALWRPNECRPALTIRERRTNNLRPYTRIHVGVLIKHDAIEI